MSDLDLVHSADLIFAIICDVLFRFKKFNLLAENEKCHSEVADNGIGMDGSVQRKRAYTKKVSASVSSKLSDSNPNLKDNLT